MSEITDVQGVLNSLRAQKSDHLRIANNKTLLQFLEKQNKQHKELETVVFSDVVLKVNKRGKEQERDLVITNIAIYNFLPGKYKQCQRSIPITKLRQLALARTSDMLLFQVRNDYDYLMHIVRRAEVVEVLVKRFSRLVKDQALKAIFADDLTKLQVTKDDLKKQQRRDGGGSHSISISLRSSRPSDSTTSAASASTNNNNSNNDNSDGNRSPSRSHVSVVRGSNYDQEDVDDDDTSSAAGRSDSGMRNDADGSANSASGGGGAADGDFNNGNRLHKSASSSSYIGPIDPRTAYFGDNGVGPFERANNSNSKKKKNNDAEEDDEEERVQGWLTKKGNTNTLWRRRYFRLTDANVLYYEGRTKGCLVIDMGAVHQWRNNRLSAQAREVLFHTYPSHIRDILTDPERTEPFLEYCQSIYSQENAQFYVAVREFRQLPPNSKAMTERAVKIVDKYVRFGAPNEISAPSVTRQPLLDEVEAKQFTPEMFDGVAHLTLSIMRVDLLPGYLEYAKKKYAQDEDFHVKTKLDEDDKKTERCTICTNAFSLITRRSHCQHCNQVMCSSCASKKTTLPDRFDVNKDVRVCHICYGVLNPRPQSEFAFTIASPDRSKPLNLAAVNQAERLRWVEALNNSLSNAEAMRAAAKKKKAGEEVPIVHLAQPNSLEGWLWKEDPTTRAWRRRYFVLRDNKLWYYEMGLKGSIPLTQGIGVHAASEKSTLTTKEATFGGFSSASNFAFRFNVSNNERVYQISADSEADRKRWIGAIQQVIHSLDPNATSDEAKAQEIAAKLGGESELQKYSAAFQEEAPTGTVAFVFTDVQNSTKLWETRPVAMNEALEMHDQVLRELLKKFRGYEVKTEGDAFMVTFSDALDAVLWCVAVQRALLKLDWPSRLLDLPAAAVQYAEDDGEVSEKKRKVFGGIRIRMGVHVGEPSCRRNPVTHRMDYFGNVVNRSARVADSAHGGQIVCTRPVHDMLKAAIDDHKFTENVHVEALGEFPYKGIKELVEVFQVTPRELVGRLPFPRLRVHDE
eukprot:TRINITY_DN68028_c0_g2_i1.p1 TRINITY_DN68028_c0_g2~~TRINITY_DN68028_c0_g2_i1.p1  ORF type:complete len:1024 (-),score=607.08 TRINITY_DN68028_c0_g2_i1:43-3114(-)